MSLDLVNSIVGLAVYIISLTICLFLYSTHKSRKLAYIVVYFLCMVSSGYYWTAYTMIVHDTPSGADWFYYFGANLSFLFLWLFLNKIKSPEEKHYFHWTMLIPIPINIVQLILYLPFGGQINSIYQVTILTIISMSAIQNICWHIKNKECKNICVPIATLLIVFCSFGMWTSSCFDGFIYNLYYVFATLILIVYLYFVWTIYRFFKINNNVIILDSNKHVIFIKRLYLVVLTTLMCGGFLFGKWIKDTLDTFPYLSSTSDFYRIITAMLFMISSLIIAFVIAIMYAINFAGKDIENTMLREEKDVADKANEAKSDFLASMSHEIRTPINAIMGMNEIILQKSAKENNKEIFENAKIIESASNNLLALINDILDFSKIESGKFEIINDNYSFGAVLRDVDNMISIRAEAKNLDFNIIVDETIPDGLFGDAKRIRQIMINLLNNAVKYTDKGSVTLRVKYEEIENSNINLVLSIEDTGIGIKEEDIDKLFNRFERLELEKNKSIEGTGLGLAITQSLLNMMSGKVDVSSTYGKGSIFKVTLPQKVIDNKAIGNFRTISVDNLIKQNIDKKGIFAPDAHILIVDDNSVNRLVESTLLKKTGVQIDLAASGPESIDMTKNNKYDLIFMDQLMPGMNGSEALKIIKSQKDNINLNTPVICLTADAIEGSKEKYINDGFDDYLTKPIKCELLEKALEIFLPKEKCL